MSKLLLLIIACSLSIGWVLPAMGDQLYAIVGLACWLFCVVWVLRSALRDHASPEAIGIAFAICTGMAFVWPALALFTIWWLNAGGWRAAADRGPPAA